MLEAAAGGRRRTTDGRTLLVVVANSAPLLTRLRSRSKVLEGMAGALDDDVDIARAAIPIIARSEMRLAMARAQRGGRD